MKLINTMQYYNHEELFVVRCVGEQLRVKAVCALKKILFSC